MVGESFVTRWKVDNAAISKTVLCYIVLHDKVVLVGIDADVCIMRKAKIHDFFEYTMSLRIAGDTMDDMILTHGF